MVLSAYAGIWGAIGMCDGKDQKADIRALSWTIAWCEIGMSKKGPSEKDILFIDGAKLAIYHVSSAMKEKKCCLFTETLIRNAPSNTPSLCCIPIDNDRGFLLA